MSFSDLGLLPELLRAVADKGYDSPSPIQIQAIPAVLAGRDVLAGVSINPQISTLRSGCDILVATPGRLLDLAQQRVADLSKVQVLVLDEADRMLDMGFINDIRKIIKLLPQKRQNLLFS